MNFEILLVIADAGTAVLNLTANQMFIKKHDKINIFKL